MNEIVNNTSFKRVEIGIILMIAFAAIIFLDLFFYPITLEDAYITFRYSEHLSEGYGFGAWNVTGERVEGYTTFLWMALLGMANSLGMDVRTASKFLGIGMHLLLSLTLITYPLLSRVSIRSKNDIFDNPHVAVLAGVFLALYLPFSWYATSGMETIFFSALVGLTFVSIFLSHNRFILPLLLILLILTRPEGIIFAVSSIVLYFFVCKREGFSFNGVYVSTGVVILAFGLLIVHRYVVFGELVPNTYWAKAGGATFAHIDWGIKYLRDWVKSHLFLFMLFCFGVVSAALSLVKLRFQKWPLGLATMVSLVLFFVLYIIKVGGDNYYAFPYWRHFVHLSPLIAFIVSYTLIKFFPQRKYFSLIAITAIALITNLSVLTARNKQMLESMKRYSVSYPHLSHVSHGEYILRLKQLSQPNTTIASAFGGELPYVVDATHIDTLGLNTRHIAKHGTFDPNGPQDSKTDMKWVLETRPDIIEGYLPGTLIMNATENEMIQYIESNWRRKMLEGLLYSPIFQSEYQFVRNWPYNDLDRAIFIKRSYSLERNLQQELDCIDVADTSLARVYAKATNTFETLK